ncbi:hypothetical protein [Auraticoccus monumenti]|uniref:Plasmid replication, integration and excision activator n=1 Tax=Auraticoccus monumenti TaxID=675864 RepID=A0A1G6WI83_9ACTN|nr:hypothetical protein [Auraticoccus monumenti]SDD65518.1 hypothetical protein SAMN04489747_1450 [Auraticoccus monumenti]
MAVQGPFKVNFNEVFPFGLGVVGAVSAQADFDASTRENRVQQRDKDTGEPVWVVDVMDFDPEARERTFKVKITAPVQPVPPDAIEGLPVRPVVLEGLMVTPYLKEVGNGRSRIAYSLRATGMSAPRGNRVQGEHNKAA